MKNLLRCLVLFFVFLSALYSFAYEGSVVSGNQNEDQKAHSTNMQQCQELLASNQLADKSDKSKFEWLFKFAGPHQKVLYDLQFCTVMTAEDLESKSGQYIELVIETIQRLSSLGIDLTGEETLQNTGIMSVRNTKQHTASVCLTIGKLPILTSQLVKVVQVPFLKRVSPISVLLSPDIGLQSPFKALEIDSTVLAEMSDDDFTSTLRKLFVLKLRDRSYFKATSYDEFQYALYSINSDKKMAISLNVFPQWVEKMQGFLNEKGIKVTTLRDYQSSEMSADPNHFYLNPNFYMFTGKIRSVLELMFLIADDLPDPKAFSFSLQNNVEVKNIGLIDQYSEYGFNELSALEILSNPLKEELRAGSLRKEFLVEIHFDEVDGMVSDEIGSHGGSLPAELQVKAVRAYLQEIMGEERAKKARILKQSYYEDEDVVVQVPIDLKTLGALLQIKDRFLNVEMEFEHSETDEDDASAETQPLIVHQMRSVRAVSISRPFAAQFRDWLHRR